MSGNTTYSFTINVSGANATATLNNVSKTAGNTSNVFDQLSSSIKRMGECSFAFNNINQGLQSLADKLDNTIAPGVELNSSLADLSAISGVTGKGLKEIEGYARATAKTFGGSAARSVESYKLLLSQLSPELAKVPGAMTEMGKHIAILSKTMGGDTTAAAEVLTTAMNQFQVSMADPVQAAGMMGQMMNIMAAAAKEGSAELPAIKSALEQSGMAAKAAGVSFAEANAAIQVLDKAGKKGSEGGVALRNVMTTLSQGRFLPKDVQEELTSAGVNINTLTDQSISLTDRLKPLRSVMNDTALITKLFGKENNNAAIALLSGLDEVDRYKTAIQGTSTAVEQAGVIMDSHAEKMSRQEAMVNDLKITLFNFTSGIMPYVKGTVTFFQGTASVMMGIKALMCFGETLWTEAIKARTRALFTGTRAMISSTGSMGFYNAMTLASVATTYAFSYAIRAVGKAIYSIPIIGWIAAGITLVITAFKILWDKCEGFRKGMFAVFEVVKAVFYNIGVVVKSVWDNIIKPYFSFWWEIAKNVATGISSAFKWCWDGLTGGIKAVGNFFVSLWDGITNGVSAVGDFFAGTWDWLKTSCSGVTSFISRAFSAIVAPIKAVFVPVWDFVSGIFNKITGALGKFFGWIGNIWNKLFPKDQFKDLGEAANNGLAKGSESWQKSQEKNGKSSTAMPGITPVAGESITLKQDNATLEKTKASKERGETIDLNNVKGSTDYAAIASKLTPVKIPGLGGQTTLAPANPGGTSKNQEKYNPGKQEYQPKNVDSLKEIVKHVTKIAAGITLLASIGGTHPAGATSPAITPLFTPTISVPVSSPVVNNNDHRVIMQGTERENQPVTPVPVVKEPASLGGIASDTRRIATGIERFRIPTMNPVFTSTVSVPMSSPVFNPVINTSTPALETPSLTVERTSSPVFPLKNNDNRGGGNGNNFEKFCDQVVINVPAGTPAENVDHIVKELMKRLNRGFDHDRI